MNELIGGIKDASLQCSHWCQTHTRPHKHPSSPVDLYRRRSSTTPANKRPDTLTPPGGRRPSNLTMSKMDSSQVCPVNYSVAETSSSSYTLSPRPALPTRPRCESASASLRYRKSPTLSIDEESGPVGEAWTSNTTIHNLPCSPKVICTPPSENTMSTVLNYSIQARKSTGSLHSSAGSLSSVSSSPSAMMTPDSSSKDVLQYHTLPNKLSHRNSMPDTAMITVIHEDCVDGSDSLSQLSNYTDEGSPRSGSTMIIRRSSLTGQLEHYRDSHSASKDLLSRKTVSHTDLNGSRSREPGFIVLNKGFRKSLRKKQSRINQIILPGIETTV